jgi:hypothetical protein
MKKISIFLAFLLCVNVGGRAQKQGTQSDPQAKAVVEKTIATFRKATVKIAFSLTMEDTKTKKKDLIKGDFVLKGDKFKITLPMAHTYYDGKTEYVHLLKSNEVSVSTPTKEEIQDLNPAFVLINSTKKSTIQFSVDDKANLPYYTIDIFPYYGDKKPYYKAIAKIDRKTFNLISIKILSQNGIHTLLQVNRFESGLTTFPDAFFVFDFKANPKAIMNDLR